MKQVSTDHLEVGFKVQYSYANMRAQLALKRYKSKGKVTW